MNNMVGKTGMFTESMQTSVEGLKVYYVTGLGEYHYFWTKDNRVFWIQINKG